MELWIEGTLVQELDTIEMKSSGGLETVFDSTHFADGENLIIEFKAWASDGTEIGTANTATVINRAHICSNSSTENLSWPSGQRPFDIAKSYYEDMNHATNESISSNDWSKDDYLASMYWTTSGYTNTHGFVGQIQAANGEIILPGDIHYVRYVALGQGLPPSNTPVFNNGGRPPMNIVFHTCCSTGADESFQEPYLYPYGTAYDTPPYQNQAFVGWNAVTAQKALKDACEAFYSRMYSGKTVDEAMEFTQTQYDANEFSIDYPAQIVCWGDIFSRLHSVYTGSNIPSLNGWYW